MYAVIDDKGKQYKVIVGEELVVDLMEAAQVDTVEFDRVLMLGGQEEEEPTLGQPQIEGARVVGQVMRHEKGPKLTIAKFKGPKQTKKGHRQKYTRVRIKEIHPG